MKLNGYTIYDRKAQLYLSPFFAVSDGAAIRSFSDLANDLSTTIGRHPMDYVLFRNGTFDDVNGMLSADNPQHVADANILVTASKDLFKPDK